MEITEVISKQFSCKSQELFHIYYSFGVKIGKISHETTIWTRSAWLDTWFP